jgi:hydroxypyruvate isomerase
MLKLAANLSLMFTEVNFLDRFAAAAAAGFDGVEFLFPYDFAPAEIAARLKQYGLSQALFNLPPGDWAGGERALPHCPGARKNSWLDWIVRSNSRWQQVAKSCTRWPEIGPREQTGTKAPRSTWTI